MHLFDVDVEPGRQTKSCELSPTRATNKIGEPCLGLRIRGVLLQHFGDAPRRLRAFVGLPRLDLRQQERKLSLLSGRHQRANLSNKAKQLLMALGQNVKINACRPLHLLSKPQRCKLLCMLVVRRSRVALKSQRVIDAVKAPDVGAPFAAILLSFARDSRAQAGILARLNNRTPPGRRVGVADLVAPYSAQVSLEEQCQSCKCRQLIGTLLRNHQHVTLVSTAADLEDEVKRPDETCATN